MKIETIEQEATALAKRFEGIDRAAFVREHSLQFSASMVYQHMTGRRPIGQSAAIEYAKAFGCALDDISPRIATEVAQAAALLRQVDELPNADAVKSHLTRETIQLHPEAQALIEEITATNVDKVGREVFMLLRQTLNLFLQTAAHRDGILAEDDPIP